MTSEEPIDLDAFIDIIRKGCNDVGQILDQVPDDYTASKILAVAITQFLVCRMRTEPEALELFSDMIRDVNTSINATKSAGMLTWTDGTPH